MNKQDMDDIFTEKVQARFQASLGTLSPETLARLSQARRKAVDAVGQPVRFGPLGIHWNWRMPAGAVALAFVAVVGGALWMGGGGMNAPSPFEAANTDAPLMMTQDSLDMYADMDFYQWMETEDQPTPAPDDSTLDDSDDEDDDTVGG
jgi:hypothetical protein